MAKRVSALRYVMSVDPIIAKPKTKRQKTAISLCDFYNARLKSAVSRFSTVRLQLRPFDRLPKQHQELFLKAASTCLEISADPKQFIIAQFESFLNFSRKTKRTRYFPQPCHLAGPGAQVRYFEFQQHKHETTINVKPTQQKVHYREDRKLRGLVRILRKPESEILVERPEEFTQDFLVARGVWPLVRDTYEATLY